MGSIMDRLVALLTWFALGAFALSVLVAVLSHNLGAVVVMLSGVALIALLRRL